MIRLFLISCFMFAASYVNAQTSYVPIIKFDSLSYNMGIMQKGDNGDCIFKFKNTGKEPVIITNVKAACGCTIPTWSSEPIIPGSEGNIVVKYNTNLIGVFRKSINVYSNIDEKPIVLTIRGEVKKK